MKLIASLTSPFARKVRVVLAEKKIDCELVLDNVWAADTRVPEINPLGKIPVLLLDDGTALYDSPVIVDYLDGVSPVSRLIAQDHRDMITIKRWEALADGINEAAANITIEKMRRKPEHQSPEMIQRQKQKVELGLEALSRELGERNWFFGESMTLADVAAGCALFYVDFRLPEVPWRTHYPNLVRLADKLAKRPSFKDTVPKA